MTPFDSTLRELTLASGEKVHYYSLAALEEGGLGPLSSLPFSLKVLLESLVRMQRHPAYEEDHVLSLARWTPGAQNRQEYPFMPSRVLLQDLTGVPCIVDLAALRSALERSGGDPSKVEPQIPVDLVIDHSAQVDAYGAPSALEHNLRREFERNQERYVFLRWGQQAFRKLRVLPPGLGICHQLNMEYLAQCVATATDEAGRKIAFPDTLVGTDSHTTQVNSMGVLGWGVGGIEAEAAMLGQPIPILTPVVTGVRLVGEMKPAATPTDLALTLTQVLREKGVVGHFVEFFGPGLEQLSLPDRAPVANMAPEYGATMGFFPMDEAALRYLRETGRPEPQVDLVERYCKAQGLFRRPRGPVPLYSDALEFDLAAVEPSVAGPRRPQERVLVRDLRADFERRLTVPAAEGGFGRGTGTFGRRQKQPVPSELQHGSIVIAAITSCTNTSNPGLLIGAGILAKKAVEKGLSVPGFVKTSLAPGSRVVTEYLKRTGLLSYLERLGFHVVAYGCTTCLGNSGPLKPEIEAAVREHDLVATAVLSGNRNFEGRIHALTRGNYLCSPALVVAYALRGTIAADLATEPLGTGKDGKPVYLRDIWPTPEEIRSFMDMASDPETYRALYRDVAASNPLWSSLPAKSGAVYDWDADSTYIREPSFFVDFPEQAPPLCDIRGAAVLGLFGDFVTTDHISPAGAIPPDSPAAAYLIAKGVRPEDFNTFGARRGNHEVMVRGTFGNIRIRNRLVDREGGWTVHHPTGEAMSMYDAAMRYQEEGKPLVVIAGRMYGAGSSRDWAAKGACLLGVRAILAESYERIHRSNLVEMGVLPLEFVHGQNAERLNLAGKETITITGLAHDLTPGKRLDVVAEAPDGGRTCFKASCRIDSPVEIDYFRNRGILQYVLRDLIGQR